jgi:hypothetical protein
MEQGTRFNLKLATDMKAINMMKDYSPRYENTIKPNYQMEDYPHMVGFFRKVFSHS